MEKYRRRSDGYRSRSLAGDPSASRHSRSREPAERPAVGAQRIGHSRTIRYRAPMMFQRPSPAVTAIATATAAYLVAAVLVTGRSARARRLPPLADGRRRDLLQRVDHSCGRKKAYHKRGPYLRERGGCCEFLVDPIFFNLPSGVSTRVRRAFCLCRCAFPPWGVCSLGAAAH